MGRQLKAMLRKNWLLKIRHPFVTSAEILLPTVVMLLLIAVRTRVDTTIHPAHSNIEKDTLVQVGQGISPSFPQVLELLIADGEFLAFAPDTDETNNMIHILSLKFPLLPLVTRIFNDDIELETYITSPHYGVCSDVRNCSNPKLKGAVVFHEQGPHVYDYSIRLNHTWALAGFPSVKSIMDTNGPYINDLEMGINTIPTMQYSFSGFLTLQQVVDSFIIFASQQNSDLPLSHSSLGSAPFELPWTMFSPSKIRMVPFPTREYTDDEFQSIVKSVMGLLYLLGFLYPISRLISYSVFEKEQKIREGLYMMGLKDEIFHLSWFITYAVQFALCAGIITACTMGSLFKYSDMTLVFTYFFLFGVSAIMLSFLISTFFTRAKTAVAVGTLAFLGAFFPYYTVNDESVSMVLKVVASLLSPTAFALGSINFADYERAHVGLRWSNIWLASSGVSFFVCLLMMLLDSILYCAIGLYLDKVLPRENGVRYPWNFIFNKCFGRKKNNQYCIPGLNTNIEGTQGEPFDPVIESISLEMRQQELDGRCIQIKNLHKVFASGRGNCCAVNSLRLTLYENQILSLLGHNGAGKSTTISMLVGLLPPTSGDALILGNSIVTNMDEIRKELGVCPQHDILFPELTVREHLEMFAVLKGVKEDSVKSTVADMAEEVGLSDKISTLVRALSGGMKRKLSLGIALIGNSKVIILDEPTSGMDPYSMRLTWQLIKKIKKGRIILLTTHSMDEAEELGDRIGIMANGSLKCCGSSMFLKHHYGVGYTLTLVKTSPAVSVATQIVHRHIPSATCVSEVGNEISFKLPLASLPCFENMFREIESCMKSSVDRSRINEIEDSDYPGIQSYGISVTTLEEVFLRVAGCNLDIEDKQEDTSVSPDTEPSLVCIESVQKSTIQPKLLASCNEGAGVVITSIAKACSLIVAAVWTFIGFISMQCCGCSVISRSMFWRHCKALFIKRARSAFRDRKTVAFQLIIPAMFLLFGLLLLQLKPHPDQKSITLTTAYFNPLLSGNGGGGPIPFDLSEPIAKEVAEYIEGGWIQPLRNSSYKFPNPKEALADAIDAAGPTLGPTLLSMSEFLMSSFDQSYESRYGAVLMDSQHPDGSVGYTVLHNSTCQHAGPIYINVMHSALLRLASGNKNMTIQTRNHPLPPTKSQRLQRHDLDAFSAAIIVSIAFSFIPASFAVPIVKEREVKAKHQQLISGVSVLSYWLSTYVWDFVSFLFPSTFAIILFYAFGLEQFIGMGRFLPTVLMLLEYGLAIASSTYCLTFFFTEHSMAQNVILMVHFFSGLILMVISFVMGLIPTTVNANSYLKTFFRLSPGFCFSDGLASLALLRQGMKDKSSHGVFDWNVTGASISYLALESIFYFLLTLGLELLPVQKVMSFSIGEWWQHFKVFKQGAGSSSTEPLLKDSTGAISADMEDDIDVQEERNRVISGLTDNAIFYLQNLRKVYPGSNHHGPKVAVQSLTFSVQAGECFGFLGTNGAGKTTTLSMLSGEETPTSGTAFVFGKDIVASPKAIRQHIGYCPQFDALFEYLTVKEHLELYARIKGVVDYRIDNVVMEKLVEFDLLKHSHKPSFTLSGGNKRKLSVAIAMIGDPPIVILDEPSTGMDPVAKRFMWDVISRLSTRSGKTAVILTTHSMNEAQALCTRIGIMVGGRLRCIGSPQHLKTRFGNHLELEVKPNEVSHVDLENLCQMIQQWLFNVPSQPRSLLGDLEVCIGVSDSITPDTASASEISLSPEMIQSIAKYLGNEQRVSTLVPPMPEEDVGFDEQLSEQLYRDGGIPLPVFAEWWLTKEKFSALDSFIQTSFPGATFKSCNGLIIKYQLPFGEGGLSLADTFGYLERNRNQLGIAEYSISQSTLETIFNHFAANS
ncbi:ABC transporter A family member 1 [Raphanus sativus]|uniref:ABC transporter A family member 1 n=2 Tax=Raphanus sativus TaxID=3726 RepID=A0A6J0MUA4_RAPSA|nr:ABC transporter A family member 1 [Raphanus sativus]